jgi:AcrR family transcriptional regulator
MDNIEELNAEQRIIEAAADVFEESGFDGARMQQIADKAGINKALLHYYFRSKDLLFEKVFLLVAEKVFSNFVKAFEEPGTIFQKIEKFMFMHQDLLYKNRKFPIFFFNEISRNPELMKKLVLKLEFNKRLRGLMVQLDEEKKAGIIRADVDVRHLMINIASLSVFPYIGRPVIKEIMSDFGFSYEKFLEERKSVIADFVINSIKA